MTKQEIIEQVKTSQSSIISKSDILEMLGKIECKSQSEDYLKTFLNEIDESISCCEDSLSIDEDDVEFSVYGKRISFNEDISVNTDDFMDELKTSLLEFVENMELDD